MRSALQVLSYVFLLACNLTHVISDEANTAYNPNRTSGAVTVVRSELQYDSRTVPLKFYLPKDPQPAPVIVLSHGLGGSREVGDTSENTGQAEDTSLWQCNMLAVTNRFGRTPDSDRACRN